MEKEKEKEEDKKKKGKTMKDERISHANSARSLLDLGDESETT